MNNNQYFIIAFLILATICLILLGTLLSTITHGIVLQDHTKDILGDIVNALIVLVSIIIGKKTMK